MARICVCTCVGMSMWDAYENKCSSHKWFDIIHVESRITIQITTKTTNTTNNNKNNKHQQKQQKQQQIDNRRQGIKI